MPDQLTPSEIKDQVLTETNAQGVLNNLKQNQSSRERMLDRWIWELLQNARDTSATVDGSRLTASISYEDGKLVFQHDGPAFSMSEIAHLIYHGSTKTEDERAIGQYGSGFLTTHLISPDIDISGRLVDGRTFRFRLSRQMGSVKALTESMDRAWNDFQAHLSEVATPSEFTAHFSYLVADESVDAVEGGLATLRQCAPFVTIFNQEFSKITIRAAGDEVVYEKMAERQLVADRCHVVTVRETTGQDERRTDYVLLQGGVTAIAAPLRNLGDRFECVPLTDTPKLFLGFPLVGTETFAFPVAINSFEFTPTEDRDGVFLLQGDDDSNQRNRAIVESACDLLTELVGLSAATGWHNVYAFADLPPLHEDKWLNVDWLRKTLKDRFVQPIRDTPAVLDTDGAAMSPSQSRLPVSAPDAVDALWHLLRDWADARDKLPRRREAVGWSHAVTSWAQIYEGEDTAVALFDEALDGSALASQVDSMTRGDEDYAEIAALQALLHGEVPVVEWLNRLHLFISENRLRETVQRYRLVLDQDGFLCTLSELHRDCDVASELKDVAQLLDRPLREELRDRRLSALQDEVGAGDLDNSLVVKDLLERLRARAKENPDEVFAKASGRLFSWLVSQRDWDHLRDFPAFSRDGNDTDLKVIYTPRVSRAEDLPLVPIRALEEHLQPFADIFPPDQILADEFFTHVPELSTWRALEEKGIVRMEVVLKKTMTFGSFFPSEPLPHGAHKTVDPVEVTDIINRPDIMARVRTSRSRALLFWRFVVEWLAKRDARGLEIHEASCGCGERHKYYRAAWLEPLRRGSESWIRLEGDKRYPVTAQSLAKLLRDGGGDIETRIKETEINSLFSAMGVSRLEFMQELFADKGESVADVETAFVDILAAAQGDVERLSQALAYIEDLRDDKDLPEVLAARRERRRLVHANQRLGGQVEQLVKESLEAEGFRVRRTGIGSDFEIQPELGDVLNLELTRNGRTWIVEVKATREQQHVRLTETQAMTAVRERTRFLLCVVNIAGDAVPDVEQVRRSMRFVQNIGDTVAPLCDGLSRLEGLRQEVTSGSGSSRVQLEVISGVARIRVAAAVWSQGGFALEDLAPRLMSG